MANRARKDAKYAASVKGKARARRFRVDNPGDSTQRMRAFRARLANETVYDPVTMLHSIPGENVAVLSDIQFPFHDGKALSGSLDWVEAKECDTVILGGDILDFYSISSFERDPAKGWAGLSLEQDLALGLQDELIEMGVRVVFIGGNHEDRWRRTIWKTRATETPEAATVNEMIAKTYGVPGDADELFKSVFVREGVTYYPYHHVLGFAGDNLLVTHGEMVRQHSGWTARAHVEKYGKSCIVGHTHRLGTYLRTDQRGPHGGWENGCLCRLDPEYAAFPNWQQGFTSFTVSGARFHVTQHPIIDGEVVG